MPSLIDASLAFQAADRATVEDATVASRGIPEYRGRRIFRTLAFALFLLGNVVSAAQAGFLYALNDQSGVPNTIYGFAVDEGSGTLAALPGFPVLTGGNGNGNTRSEELFFDSLNSRLFAINVGSASVSAFSVDRATGGLTALPYSPIALPVGDYACLAVHPTGSPLLIGDRAGSSVVSIALTGASASLVGTAATTDGVNTGYPFSCVFSRDGNYFYTGGNTAKEYFAGFSVDAASGVLTPLAGSPFFAGSFLPEAYATDAAGRLFATGNGIPPELRVFTTSNGIPTRLPAFVSGLSNATFGLLHPAGFYLVADRVGNRVGVFAITGSGAATTLAAVAGSPFSSGGSFTDVLALNQNGVFLFAANGNSRNITTFGVNSSSGALTALSLLPANSVGASGRIVGMAYVGATPVLQSAASRRNHSAAGTFNLPLSLVPTAPTVEPRQGPAQTIVFSFDKPIASATATVTEGTATATTPTFSGNDVIVALTGVSNQQYVTIALTDVVSVDGATGGTGSIRVGYLLGDVNQNRAVSLSDLGQVNAQIAQPVTAANFLKDVNVSGTLSLADKGITNTQVTKALLSP